MISFYLTVILALLLFVGLIIKLCNVKLAKSANRFICLILPLLCIAMFIALMFESSFKRKAQLRELDSMLSIVKNGINSNRVFESDEEKLRCLDSLLWQKQILSKIAFEDSLVSIISSHDTLIENRIRQTDNAISQQIKRIERLNDFYNSELKIDTVIQDHGTIELIEPVTDRLTTWNFAFKCNRSVENIVCTYVLILSKDSIIYQKAFVYNEKINCFVVPHKPDSEEIIRAGYIIKNNNINEFRYTTYAND